MALETLKKRADFLTINTKGQKWVAQGMIVQVMPNGLDRIRVGYTVSKRTDKSSVKRNRIKRRLRAVAAQIIPAYGKDSYDYVLIGRPASATRPFISLTNDLKWCLEKMGAVRDA